MSELKSWQGLPADALAPDSPASEASEDKSLALQSMICEVRDAA